MKASAWATNLAIVVVLGMWATSLVVDMLSPTYDPPPGIEPMMMALAGFLFAARTQSGKAEAKPEQEQNKEER